MSDRQTPYSAILQRAGEDAEFRVRLLADPRKAIAEVLGRPVPDGFQIDVVENTSRHVTLVLPPVDSGELSDSELEAVAGGSGKRDSCYSYDPYRCNSYSTQQV